MARWGVALGGIGHSAPSVFFPHLGFQASDRLGAAWSVSGSGPDTARSVLVCSPRTGANPAFYFLKVLEIYVLSALKEKRHFTNIS